MSPRSLAPALSILVASACTARDIPSCGDGIPDAGEACLERLDLEVDELLALGDVDGDGRADAVVVADADTARVGVQLGQVDGTLAPATDGIRGPGVPVAAIGDADGDERPDVVLWWPGIEGDPGQICGHALDASGLLVEQWCHAAHQTPSGQWDALFVGALGPAGEPGFAAWTSQETLVVVDPADRAIRSSLDLPINFNGSRHKVIADLEGDGLDVLLQVENDGELQLHGSEGLRTRIEIPSGMDHPVIGDFDGDGIDDVALRFGLPCNSVFDAWIRRSTGPTTRLTFDATDECGELLAGDLDGDGLDELFMLGSAGLMGAWGHRLDADPEPVVEWLDPGPRDDGHSGAVVHDVDGNGTDDVLRIVGVIDQADLSRWITEIWLGEP